VKSLNIREGLESEMVVMQNQMRNKDDQFKDLESIMKKGWEHNEKAIKGIQSQEIENIKLQLSLENEK